MGSLPSPPRPSNPPPSSAGHSPLSNYRVYTSFRHRGLGLRTNITNWLEYYNPCNNAWTFVSTIPSPIDNHFLKGFAMVSVEDSIYIIGGRLCTKEKSRIFEDSDDYHDVNVKVLSSMYRYNVRMDQWSECAALGTPRYDFACTVCENKIYVAGGQSLLASARGISSAEMYNPISDDWTPLPSMSTLRYKCVGVTWQGKIHVVGGFAERARGETNRAVPYMMERSSAEVYDTSSGKWDLVAGMWQLDVPPNQIVAINGTLFSSGDCLNSWKGHIESYDEKCNMWNEVEGSRIQTLNSPISTTNAEDGNWPPSQRLYLSMAPIRSSLYFLEGYRTAGELCRTMSIVHIFDTAESCNAWSSLEPMEEEGEKELCSHCCVVQLL